MSRVLVVGKGPPDRGGISAFIGSLLGSDLTRTHELRHLNLTRNETPQGGRFTRANVTRTLSDARAVWRESAGTDVVHIHSALVPGVTMVRASLLATMARLRGRSVVLHAHSGFVERWLSSPPRRALARLLLLPADRIVTMSHKSAEAIAKAVGSRKISVLDNWVDLEEFSPGDETNVPPRILYAGLLTPRKGVGDLLNACRSLADAGAHHELVIAGGTPNEGVHAEEDVRRIVCPTARFVGALPHEEMAKLFGDSDIFCLPSWWEAMPMSILEAMASGLPIVATAVGDIPRVVEDGVTGILVQPQDADALAVALRTLIDDPDLRRRMGAAARRRAEESFNASKTVSALDALYRQLGP